LCHASFNQAGCLWVIAYRDKKDLLGVFVRAPLHSQKDILAGN
jgi:hypothetical protein